MGDGTKIEWSDATWNPFVGCTAVSPGCDHCYAARQSSGRLKNTPTYKGLAEGGIFNGTVRLLPDRLDQPIKWTRPRRIFVNSMSDLFHEGVPDDYIAKVFAVMALTARHTYQVLTKRHGRMRSILSSGDFRTAVAEEASEIIGHTPARLGRQLDLGGQRLAGDSGIGDGWQVRRYGGENLWIPPWPLPNVWMGVSVEDQKWAEIRIPMLLETPAAVRFLSCEPLLGPVELGDALLPHECDTCTSTGRDGRGIQWVIVGGESGPGARPIHPDWVRRIRDDCIIAGVPLHYKQWGEWLPRESAGATLARGVWVYPDGSTSTGVLSDGREGAAAMFRVGKRLAGRVLDGETWDEWPTTEAVPA